MRCFISGLPSFFPSLHAICSQMQVKLLKQISAAGKFTNSPSWPYQIRDGEFECECGEVCAWPLMQQLAAFLVQLTFTVHLASFNWKMKQKKKGSSINSQQPNDNSGRSFLFPSAQFHFQNLRKELNREREYRNIYLTKYFCAILAADLILWEYIREETVGRNDCWNT